MMADSEQDIKKKREKEIEKREKGKREG